MNYKNKKFINPYISKVENDKKIINNELNAFKNKGNWSKYFNNNNPIILEIGTGLGNFFSNEVIKNKFNNYIGLEIKFKRIFISSEKTKQKGGENFVLIKTKGENIHNLFSKNEIYKTYVFFPDPWDKNDKQKKHRLLNESFFKRLYSITSNNGIFIFKTDHIEYFNNVLDIIKKIGIWKINKLSYDYESEIPEFDIQNLTEFESIFRKDKIKINYLKLNK